MSGPEKTRFQVEMDDESARQLEELRDQAGVSTKKQLFNLALSFLNWGVGETRNGRQIGSRNAAATDFVRVLLPGLGGEGSVSAEGESAPAIVRTVAELREYLSRLDYRGSDQHYEYALGRLLDLLPAEFARVAAMQERTRLSVLRDALLTLETDVMDIDELRRRQVTEPHRSVTVLARNFLDLAELYDTVVENLQRGISYTYWQLDDIEFQELAGRLRDESGFGQETLDKLMTCVVAPDIVFVTDILLYDIGLDSMKGYVNRLMQGRTVHLLPMDEEHLRFISRRLERVQKEIHAEGGTFKMGSYSARIVKPAA